MRYFIITHMKERDENDRALAWSKEWGWVVKGSGETVFSCTERRDESFGLPQGGQWTEVE